MKEIKAMLTLINSDEGTLSLEMKCSIVLFSISNDFSVIVRENKTVPCKRSIVVGRLPSSFHSINAI